MRKGIAAQMTRALQAPHAYVQMEIDATRLVAFRERAKKEYQAKEGFSLSYVPFVVKASAEALKRNPTFNANWTEQGLLAKRRINIGVAVAVDDGLIVPVIRDADRSTIQEIAAARADLVARARDGKLQLADLEDGTFTISNLGMFGIEQFIAVLNPPQAAILAVGATTETPVARNGQVEVRPLLTLTLTCDHRAVDGADGADFLRTVKELLEEPALAL
jgi:pyruvate dehydrogenase E2 component (dihydrolipoamide acetyltransferase)